MACTKSHHIYCIHFEYLELCSYCILWLWFCTWYEYSTLGVSRVRIKCIHLLYTGWNWWKASKTYKNIITVRRIIWSWFGLLQHTLHYDLSIQSVWNCKFPNNSNANHDIQYLLKFLCKWVWCVPTITLSSLLMLLLLLLFSKKKMCSLFCFKYQFNVYVCCICSFHILKSTIQVLCFYPLVTMELFGV